MKYFICLSIALLLWGCSLQRVERNKVCKTESTRIQKMPWATPEDCQLALKDDTNPIYVLFSGPGCPSCDRLARIMKKEGWDKQVLVLNVAEGWVNEMASKMSVDSIPTFFVLDKKKDENSKKIIGLPAIATYMAVFFN